MAYQLTVRYLPPREIPSLLLCIDSCNRGSYDFNNISLSMDVKKSSWIDIDTDSSISFPDDIALNRADNARKYCISRKSLMLQMVLVDIN